jgi:hypothetical protein
VDTLDGRPSRRRSIMSPTPHHSRFTIRPPCTTGDSGDPGPSLGKDVERVFDFIEDERHLTAHDLLKDVRRRIKEQEAIATRNSTRSSKRKPSRLAIIKRKESAKLETEQLDREELDRAKEILNSNNAAIDKLENRVRIFRKALHNLNEDDEWTYASTHFGIKTFYRREEDESLSVKLEGEIEGVPLFEQICVLKEVDLHYKWAPFCSSSMTVADLDKLDTVGWFMIGLPHFGVARDGCFRAIGCDNIIEDGSILLVGQGVHDRPPDAPPPEDPFLSEDPILNDLGIPPVPKRRGSGRMTIRKFESVIHVLSPTSAKTRIVANIDPNMAFLPQSLLEFLMKHLAGVMLAKLQAATKKVLKNPVSNEHARKMREHEDFYKHWLMQKFQAVCKAHGWKMPAVPAFELTEEQQRKENALAERRANRGERFETRGAIVQNLSLTVHTTPPRRADYGDGSVSELSSRSVGSVWSKNPISTYLRDIEQKTQERKDAAIAETRQIAASRLLPKDFSSDKQERLQELKAAKARRTIDRPKATVSTTGFQTEISRTPSSAMFAVEEARTFWHKATSKLHRHGLWTRTIVVVVLMSTLFVFLHPLLLAKILSVKWASADTWWRSALQDIGTVLYLAVCTVIHFIVCDISLVYVFSALELGSKTGRHIKNFYSDNVRLGVAASSFGIYGASLLKATGNVCLRLGVWSSVYAYRKLGKMLERTLPVFPPSVSAVLYDSSESFQGAVAVLLKVLRQSARLIWTYFVHSHFVGRKFEDLFFRSTSFVSSSVKQVSRFVKYSVESHEGKIEVDLWRMEAFCTARTLFSYTSVFLLSVLVLFTVLARQNRFSSSEGIIDQKADTNKISKAAKAKYAQSMVSSLSTDENPATSDRAVYNPIPENEVMVQDAGKQVLHPIPKLDASSPLSSKRTSRFLRLRRKKANSMPISNGASFDHGKLNSRGTTSEPELHRAKTF